VTHDHDLIDEVATRIWHFETDHKITDFKDLRGISGGRYGLVGHRILPAWPI